MILIFLFFTFFTVFCNGMMTPGEFIKAPGEVIQNCKDYYKQQNERNHSIITVTLGNGEEYTYKETYCDDWQDELSDLKKLEKLLPELLFGYMLCDIYLKVGDSTKPIYEFPSMSFSDRNDYPNTHLVIKNFLSPWRNPELYNNKSNDERSTIFLNRKQEILEDCKECKEYKGELMKYFIELNNEYIHKKRREPLYAKYAKEEEAFKNWMKENKN